MKCSSWLLQIYEMADPTAQQAAVSFLADMPGLTVDACTCDRGSFVIVECADATQAMAMYELVMMADAGAELIHSVTGDAVGQARDRQAAAATLQDASRRTAGATSHTASERSRAE